MTNLTEAVHHAGDHRDEDRLSEATSGQQFLTFTVPEFMAAFKIGRTKVYEEIDSGRLRTYKVGRNRYISARAADQWQRSLEADGSIGAHDERAGKVRS